MSKQCRRSNNPIRKIYAAVCTSPLKMHTVIDAPYVRVGRNQDGGYVLADYILNCDELWSFGVGGDISFEYQLAEKGVKCYLFDFSVDDIPLKHKNISFYRLGLSDRDVGTMRTLSSIMKTYGESGIDSSKRILKMDIEGWEWPVLQSLSTSTINLFDQIVMECHYMCGLNIKRAFQQKKILAELCKTHALVHVHGNNISKYVVVKERVVPYYLECTFVNKRHKMKQEFRSFPTELDFPNDISQKDINLGIWE